MPAAAAVTRAPLPPPFPVGARVRYNGKSEMWCLDRNGEKVPIIEPGIIVVVSEVRPGRRGTGRRLRDEDGWMEYEDGSPILDETRDGYSVYRVDVNGLPQWGRCIDAGNGEWERLD